MLPYSRVSIIALLIALVAGCGGTQKPDPQAAASAGAATPSGHSAHPKSGQQSTTAATRPPLPKPIEGAFSIPIRLPLRMIAQRIDAELPRRQKQGWQQLTRTGKSPSVEARYEFWRDPVQVSFKHSSLHVEIPIRYAARFNARLKNPFGRNWFRLARNEPWGTKRQPQRITIHVRAKVKIDASWKLKLSTKVAAPEHGRAPSGKLCSGGSFKLCVARSSLAPHVRKQLDAELLRRMREAATKLDKSARDFLRLRHYAREAWKALSRPLPLAHGRFVKISATHAALDIRRNADAIVVEPAISARLSYHEGKPPSSGKRPPLPPRTPLHKLPGTRVAVPTELLPFDLQGLVERALRPGPLI